MKFLDIGTITSTGGAQAFPRGDGAPQAITATTITLPTSAVDASAGLNFYKHHLVMVIAGQGAGQERMILSSTTAYLCTVQTWGIPRPDTGSTIVIGAPVKGRDGVAVKGEHVGTATTGTFRLQTYVRMPFIGTSRTDTMRSIVTATFPMTITLATAGLSSSAGYHAQTQLLDYVGEENTVAKVFVETAPTANVELFLAPVSLQGRMRQ